MTDLYTVRANKKMIDLFDQMFVPRWGGYYEDLAEGWEWVRSVNEYIGRPGPAPGDWIAVLSDCPIDPWGDIGYAFRVGEDGAWVQDVGWSLIAGVPRATCEPPRRECSNYKDLPCRREPEKRRDADDLPF